MSTGPAEPTPPDAETIYARSSQNRGVSDHDVALALARAALNSLERNRRRLDDLNVYPVPDGDTGTNLTHTVRAVVDALETRAGGADRAALARFVARATLLGGRGNSGVILSVIVRGATDVLGAAHGIDPAVVAAALRRPSDPAYATVSEPVEGTILTAIRSLAEAAEARRTRPSRRPLLPRIVERGDEAVLAHRTSSRCCATRESSTPARPG